MIDCPHAARCTGCTRLEQPYSEQLVDKRAALTSALSRYPELSLVSVGPCEPASPLVGYRARAKWVVEGGKVGLFARGDAHEVLDLPGCVVVPRGFVAVADALRAALASGMSGAGAVSALDVRGARDGGEERLLVTLVHDSRLREPDAALAPLAARLLEVPGVAGVARAPRDPRSPRALGGAPRPLLGATRAPDDGRLATFGGFAQAHRVQAARVADMVVAALGDTGSRTVLELFGGEGALGLSLARAGAEVELVELVGHAAQAAADVARRDGLPLTARAADAEILASLPPRDLVLVDPPRRGLTPGLREAVARAARRAIVVVSCEPSTLARDLAHLARLGFAARSALPVDMIPLSDSVEAVAVLLPAPPPPLRVLHEDDDLVVVDKPPHLSRAALEAAVRARFPRAVSLGAPPAEASGVAPFARSIVAAARARHALGEVTWTARVRGVPHARGVLTRRATAPTLSYTRGEIDAGHATITLVSREIGGADPLPALARIGHPALGDARHGHGATNARWFATAGLDRAWLHASRVAVGASIVESPLPADLPLPPRA